MTIGAAREGVSAKAKLGGTFGWSNARSVSALLASALLTHNKRKRKEKEQEEA